MHINDSKKLTEAGTAIRRIYTDGLFQNNLGKAIQVSNEIDNFFTFLNSNPSDHDIKSY